MVFSDRKRVVVRTDSQHAIYVWSTAVCQATTEETIHENSPKHSSASMGATELVNRLVEKKHDTRATGTGDEHRHQHHGSTPPVGRSTRLLVAEPLRSRAPRSHAPPRYQKKAIWRVKLGGASLLEGVKGEKQRKFEDRWRLGTWLGKPGSSEEHFIEDADGMHVARSTQRRLLQHRWKTQQVQDLVGTSWR